MSNMKSTEEIIKDKLDGRGFAFNESAWAGMENLLDAQEKKRKQAILWWFSASSLIALVAVGAYFYNTNRVSQVNPIVSEANSTGLKANSDVSEVHTTVSETKTIKPEVNTTTSEVGTTVSEVKVTGSKAKTTKSKSKTSVSQANSIKSQANTTKLKANTTVLNDKLTVSDVNPTKAEVNTTVLGNNTIISEPNTSVLNDNTIVSDINTTIAEANTTGLNDNPIEVEVNTPVSEATTSENSENKVDSAQNGLETAQNPLAAPGKETKNAWGILAGAGYWFPYKTTYGAYTNEGRFGFTGGIYYNRLLSKRWEIGLSAIYSSRGALDFDKTFTNTNFGFGSESQKITVSPKTLHYLNIPFSIRFNLSQRSHIYVGTAYYQLLATTSKITTTTQNSFGEVITSESDKQTGKHNGFLNYDVSAFLGYELTLFDRMNLGFQMNYGFYDITDNAYKYEANEIQVPSYDRNISLQLHLKYDIIKH